MSDWISREDALKTLSTLVEAAIEGRLAERIEGLRDALDIIRALPAVQPEPKPKPFDCQCGAVGPCEAPFCFAPIDKD